MDYISDPALRHLIDELQTQSQSQQSELVTYFSRLSEAGKLNWGRLDEDAHTFFADKMVALDEDKARFCHMLCRATNALRVVEVGSSYGVSTLYLADAVRGNGDGRVIATEYEPGKAEKARNNYRKGGVSEFIELREGDLRETLKSIHGPVDFVLMDIWTEMVVPAMELITPHLRRGAIVVADNTRDFAAPYADYFDFLERNDFVTQTLPFDGGLELTIKQ